MSRIGIKLDGVLIDKVKFQRIYGEEFFKENNKGRNNIQPSIQPWVSSFRAMFACAKEDCDRFWKKYYRKYCTSAECEQDAKDIIDELRNQRNEIYLVVTRQNTLENGIKGVINKHLLARWLISNGILCDAIIYCDNNQISDVCKNFAVDIYIEDVRNEAQFISNSVNRVLLFDRPYNRDLDNISNIERVEGFKGVYENISDTCKTKGYK